MSQIFYLGPSFEFMLNNGKLCVFLKVIILDFIKQNLGPK